MVKRLVDSLAGSLLGMGVLGGGFYLLYLAFLNDNLLQGLGGGGLVPLGMWLIARARRTTAGPPR